MGTLVNRGQIIDLPDLLYFKIRFSNQIWPCVVDGTRGNDVVAVLVVVVYFLLNYCMGFASRLLTLMQGLLDQF